MRIPSTQQFRLVVQAVGAKAPRRPFTAPPRRPAPGFSYTFLSEALNRTGRKAVVPFGIPLLAATPKLSQPRSEAENRNLLAVTGPVANENQPTDKKQEKSPLDLERLKKLTPVEQREELTKLPAAEQRRLFFFEGIGDEPFEPVSRQDVRGMNNIISEIYKYVYYIKNPEIADGHSPRPELPVGILLSGPPRTGKTMTSRLIAAELKVRLINVRLFPGVGSEGFTKEDIREFFSLARSYYEKRKEWIVAVWEGIDQVAVDRDKFRQMPKKVEACTEFLEQLDGPHGRPEGIFIIGITNSSQQIDPAALAPRRIADHYQFQAPDLNGRTVHLEHYVSQYPHENGIDYEMLSELFLNDTPTAPKIEETVKKAWRDTIIDPDRKGEPLLTHDSLAKAILISEWGVPSNISRNNQELFETSVHEIGHAVVARRLHVPVQMVTIVPSFQNLGKAVTQIRSRNLSYDQCLAIIAMSFGSQVAEEICHIEPTTGVLSDLTNASQFSTKLVEDFGIGPSMDGFAIKGIHEHRRDNQQQNQKKFSDKMLQRTEKDIEKIYRNQRALAKRILTEFGRERIEWLANRLKEKKTIFQKDLDCLIAEAERLFLGKTKKK